MRCAGGFLGNKGVDGGPSPDEAANRRARPMLNDSISSLFFLFGPRHLFLCFRMHASLCALPRVFYFLGARLEGRPDGYSGLQDDQLLFLSLLPSHRSVTTVQDDAHQARHTLSVWCCFQWCGWCVPRLLVEWSPSRRGTGIEANG